MNTQRAGLSLDPGLVRTVLDRLKSSDRTDARVYPGEPIGRQPVHTVYGGGHLFRRDTARRLGETARESMRVFAPDAERFGRAIGLEAGPDLQRSVYTRVLEKLEREPVEDFRIDFEDGYGTRDDAEEDAHAAQAAAETAAGMAAGTLPPFMGIRIKNFGPGTRERGIRTLDVYLSTLGPLTGWKLPDNFVVMLPKLVSADQVSALVELFEAFEGGSSAHFAPGSLRMEFMVETTRSVIDASGVCPLPEFVRAARGRCVAAALGVYDYTASLGITANQQRIDHRGCDFARHVMQVALGGSGLFLSDGATNIMPTPPHAAPTGSPLTPEQERENTATVHSAWKLNFGHVRRSLSHGWYQGWDLNPAQLPVRYAAVYSYFLEYLPEATRRLSNFVEKAARATLVRGDSGAGVFDDAATAQGLLTFFIQGLRRRAISDEDLARTGLSRDEVAMRSFTDIVRRRAGKNR